MSRITKRKLDDAIEKLDSVLTPSPADMDPPSPSKKPNTSRTSSIYASLNKINLFKSSPPRESSSGHTRAISLPYALASKSAYRPESSQDFLNRLATFKVATYTDKPAELNPVAAAKAGWSNEGKERLLCTYCGASWAIASSQGLSKDAAQTLLNRQCAGLVSNHKEICPWKKAQCDDSVYRIPLKGPTVLAREIKAKAEALAPLTEGLQLKHPLTADDIQSLKETITFVSIAEAQRAKEALHSDSVEVLNSDTDIPGSTSSPDNLPSEASLVLAVFGWDATPFAAPPPLPRSHSSYSRANSPFTTVSSRGATPTAVAETPSRHSATLSRVSGQRIAKTQNRQSLPTHTELGANASLVSLAGAKQGSVRTISGGSIALTSSMRKGSGTSTNVSIGANPMVHCQLCLRRVGLWSFITDAPGVEGSTRPLDVIKEHRTYCPYVTKSTVVPIPVFSDPNGTSLHRNGSTGSISSVKRTFSSSVNSGFGSSTRLDQEKVEGWRAVLIVIKRSGIGLRFRRTGSTTSVLRKPRPIPRPPSGPAGSVSFSVREQGAGSRHSTPVEEEDPERSRSTDPQLDDADSADNTNVGVEKIVENVKKSKDGSRELLRYVKDLLRRGDHPSTPSRPPSDTHGGFCGSLKRKRTMTPPSRTPP